MATLSVVIAVKNEEKKIKDCLESVKWADEIIVIDMFSTDKTIEIAKKYTSKIFQSAGGEFGLIEYNKEFGFEKASCDWILDLDADERVSKSLREKIQKILSSQLEEINYDGFRITRNGPFLGHDMKLWSKPEVIKLLLRKKGKYVDVAPVSTISGLKKIGTINEPIIHDDIPIGKLTTEIFMAKYNLYSSQTALFETAHRRIKSNVFIRSSIARHYFLNKIMPFEFVLDPIRAFFYWFIKLKAYKDGAYGLIYSLFMVVFVLMERIKFWEIQNFHKGTALLDKKIEKRY